MLDVAIAVSFDSALTSGTSGLASGVSGEQATLDIATKTAAEINFLPIDTVFPSGFEFLLSILPINSGSCPFRQSGCSPTNLAATLHNFLHSSTRGGGKK